MKKNNDKKKDKRTNHQMKYFGEEERKVHLARNTFVVHKGDLFDVSLRDAKRFEGKEEFKQVR